jgi:hypothetical protein
MNPALKLLLEDIRQHPAFPELLKAVSCPPMPRFKPNSPESTEIMGSKFLFASGQADQHERWLTFLRGTTQQE